MAKFEIGREGRPARNFQTGVFLKGHIPHNAGKKWDEWLSKEKQEKILEIGRKNLRVNKSLWGANRRAVICVDESGNHRYFESGKKAAEIMGLDANNITACCRGKRKHCGKYRWFYFDSDEWVKFVNEKKKYGATL